MLRKSLSGSGAVQAVLYADEATAGNVLSVDKSRKTLLFYLGFLESWHYLKSPSAWLLVAAIQSDCVQAIKGQAGAVATEIVRRLVSTEHLQGYSLGHNLHFRLAPSMWYHGDLDSIRMIFALKGAAGMRPCLLCKNLVKNGSGIPERNPNFQELSACHGFMTNSDVDIFLDCDRIQQQRTRKDREALEKSSGIRFDAHGFLFSDLRAQMPPSNIIFDVMHTYFCNGVCSWELALFVKVIMDHTGLTLAAIRSMVVDMEWKSLSGSGRTINYLKALLSDKIFADDWSNYKGQAHQTSSVLPLLLYFVMEQCPNRAQIPSGFLQSFQCLFECVQRISQLQSQLTPLTAANMQPLDRLQRKHHELFRVFEIDHKPKHHARLHLPKMWLHAGVMVSCEPLESKHLLFKGPIAQNQKSLVKNWSAFSHSVLPRLVRTHVSRVVKHGLPLWQLMEPISEASLDDKIYFAHHDVLSSSSILSSFSRRCAPLPACHGPYPFVKRCARS
eukprot:Skav213088  [mRNA]  locus=scaffold512:14254:15756:+ [translate_table: standard]